MFWADRMMRSMFRLIVVFTLSAAAYAFAQASSEASGSRVIIPTLAASAVGSAVDQEAASGTQRMSLVLTLKPTSDRVTALDQFLESAITPGSASYHQWLTPAQFGTTYGPAPIRSPQPRRGLSRRG
jgi:subtilase family serine protease